MLKVISWMRECDITLFTMDSSYQLMFSDIEIKNYLERAKIDKNLIPFVAIVDQLLFALRDDCVFEEGLNIVKQNLQQAGNMESLSARILQRSSPGKLIKGSRYIEESRYVEKSRYAEGGRYAKGGRDHSPPKPRISHQLRMKTVE